MNESDQTAPSMAGDTDLRNKSIEPDGAEAEATPSTAGELDFVVQNDLQPAVIKVIGVGGGGCNAVQHMLDKNLEGVEFVAINTDVQALSYLSVGNKLAIGTTVTGGLGAGANPDIGQQAALEDADRISAMLEGAHMVFIAAGMGGGTGTGAAPEVARLAREKNVLTVAVVTRPFEAENREDAANQGLARLKEAVDSLIVISNDKLLKMSSERLTVLKAFAIGNDVLHGAVEGISDLVLKPGIINVDFADVCTVMSEMGSAMMGTGYGEGENAARQAAQEAIECPLLDGVDMHGARGILVNITSGPSLALNELNEVTNLVKERASKSANLISGWVMEPEMENQVKVTIVATGLGDQLKLVKERRPPISIDPSGKYSDLEHPSFQRRTVGRTVNPSADRAPTGTSTASSEQEIKWLDMPKFLRQQAD